MSERNYWQRMKHRQLSRRSLLRASARAGVGAAGLALVGCGGDDDDDDGQPAAAQAPAQEQQAEQQAMQQQQQEQQDQAAVAEAQQTQQAQAMQDARRGGAWRISDAFAPQWGFDPLITPSGGDHYQSIPIFYDRLLNYDEQGAALPMLAEGWEIPDDVTWRYTANEVFAPTLSLFYDKPPGMAPISPASFDDAITPPGRSRSVLVRQVHRGRRTDGDAVRGVLERREHLSRRLQLPGSA